ncbi:hypothetical protein PQR02_16170, partial [Paraburkholderia sediminicola]
KSTPRNAYPAESVTFPKSAVTFAEICSKTKSEICPLPYNYQVAGKHPAIRFDSLHTKPARLLRQAVRLLLHVHFLWAGRSGRAARLAGLV